MSKHSLLIVEDDSLIRQGLTDVFTFAGYEVSACADGLEAYKKYQTGTYHILILDVMLPGMDGFELCRQIRKLNRSQAIVMLTARNAEEDILKALQFGADDYITKPFSIPVLKARVEALLRRSNPRQDLQTFHLGSLAINPSLLEGKSAKQNLEFTKREMDVLLYLKANTEKIVTRDDLLTHVWGYRNVEQIDTRTVDIHITKLRKKVEPDPAKPIYILTLRGEGYRLKI